MGRGSSALGFVTFKIPNGQDRVHLLVWRPWWRLGICVLKSRYPGWGGGRDELEEVFWR